MSLPQDPDHIRILIALALDRQATPGQLKELIEAIRQDSDGHILQLIQSALPDNLPVQTPVSGAGRWDNILHSIFQADTPILTADLEPPANSLSPAPHTKAPPLPHAKTSSPVRRIRFLKTGWFRYAAILLLIAGTVILLFRINQPHKEITKNPPVQQPDILPGGNKAILTLADGRSIVLDTAANGQLATQGLTQIVKRNGLLAYKGGTRAEGDVLYNTITTPRGGQYQLVLPDGSRIWLNAASSVKFPVAFATNRTVAVTGEVYLEVIHDKSQPFKVVINDLTTIDVLGTSFNINAYKDEPTIKTTLAEGSVNIHANGQSRVLKPHQQAQISISSGIQSVKEVDVDKVTDWKNGFFNMEGADLKDLLRQVSRWYDVEVDDTKGVKDIQFFGRISRSLPLGDLIRALEDNDIHVRLAGRRLIITP